jgi:hypothetical protein
VDSSPFFPRWSRFLSPHGRRPGEHGYLGAVNAAVTLNVFRQIALGAVEDAKNGDAKARDWLTTRLLGDKRLSLMELAANEQAGMTVDAVIDAETADAMEQKLPASSEAGRRSMSTAPTVHDIAGDDCRDAGMGIDHIVERWVT